MSGDCHIVDDPTQGLDGKAARGGIPGQHRHVSGIVGKVCDSRDQRGAGTTPGRILLRPRHVDGQGPLRPDDDDRVGTLCDAGHSHLEQDASLRIAQVELVGTEGTLLAARDDDGG